MAANDHVGTYIYSAPSAPDHAPYQIDDGSTVSALVYDANGNMTTGLSKTMTYDGENRPLTVTASAKTTAYVYGADGTRLKKIEDQGGAGEVTTAYFGPVEIRDFGGGTSEEVLTYPVDALRLTDGTASYLHRDQLSSVRAITNASGALAKHSSYKPFGVANDITVLPATAPESEPGCAIGPSIRVNGFIRSRALISSIPCHGSGPTLRRRRRAPVPQRPILRPRAGDIHPAGLVRGDRAGGWDEYPTLSVQLPTDATGRASHSGNPRWIINTT